MVTNTKYAKETLWAVAAKAAAFFFYYGLVYYLTRKMTVEVWGDWSAFLALLNIILLISDQGLNVAVKRYVLSARDSAELGGVVRVTFALRVLASLVFTLAIAFLIPPLLKLLGQPSYIPLLQRSLLLIALYGMMEYFKYLFEALHRLRFTFVVTALEHGFKFLLVIILFRGGEQFVAIILAFTVAVAIAFAAGLILTLWTVPGLFNSAAPARMMRQAYLYSLPVFLMSIAGFISLEIDTIMLKSLRTDYETGIYSAAKQIIMFLPHISLTVSMGTIPGIAVFDESSALSQRRIYYRILGGIAAIYLLVCLGVAALALWGMDLFFRPEYHAASAPLLALIPFAIFNAATIYSGSLMVYRGLAWQRSINVVLTVLANVLLNWWLIPIWGAIGAAVASSIAYLPYCILNLRAAHKAFALTGGPEIPQN
jgi:O-antigen/teichoic acid export membrane protein